MRLFANRNGMLRPALLPLLGGLAACALLASTAPTTATAGGARLDAALDAIVAEPLGPPGVSVLIKRRNGTDFRTRGVANVTNGAKPLRRQHYRIASMAKALSGAVALALVSKGKLELDDTIDEVLPGLWPKAGDVTLAQVLQHTAGLPDYIRDPRFLAELRRDPTQYMTPEQLIGFVDNKRPDPGPYEYSDSDNVIVGLMAEAATGRGYDRLLDRFVYRKAGMQRTSLPDTIAMPRPFLRGYEISAMDPPEDVSETINPALAWASGGIVSTPTDVGRFFRAYVGGDLFDPATARAQDDYVPGSSQPPGPGRNEATLGLFRYRTRCGKVYGHTGSFPGYRVFAASSASGRRSVVFTVNSQIVPGMGSPRVSGLIRQAQVEAVCLALR